MCLWMTDTLAENSLKADEADNFPGGWANRRFPENWTEMLSNGGDNWVYNLTAEVDPTVGDAGIRVSSDADSDSRLHKLTDF